MSTKGKKAFINNKAKKGKKKIHPPSKKLNETHFCIKIIFLL